MKIVHQKCHTDKQQDIGVVGLSVASEEERVQFQTLNNTQTLNFNTSYETVAVHLVVEVIVESLWYATCCVCIIAQMIFL
jgi:hypothetical protein